MACPRDLSLVTFDSEVRLDSGVRISYFRTFPRELGRRGAQQLYQLMTASHPGDKVCKTLVPLEFQEGNSVKEHYQGLGHVAIETDDLEASIAFYEKLEGTVLKRDATPDGAKKLALVDFGGVCLELIQPQEKIAGGSGSIPHFAVYVDDLDAVAAQIKAAGVDTFRTPEKLVMPNTFGGLQTWFFEGPSGEIIELLQML